jgi:hypothetical protein
MDQRADPGDQQHEADRQLVQLQTRGHVETRHVDPGEHGDLPAALVAREAQHLDVGGHRVAERGHRHEDAEPVAPPVGPPPTEQQHGRAE